MKKLEYNDPAFDAALVEEFNKSENENDFFGKDDGPRNFLFAKKQSQEQVQQQQLRQAQAAAPAAPAQAAVPAAPAQSAHINRLNYDIMGKYFFGILKFREGNNEKDFRIAFDRNFVKDHFPHFCNTFPHFCNTVKMSNPLKESHITELIKCINDTLTDQSNVHKFYNDVIHGTAYKESMKHNNNDARRVRYMTQIRLATATDKKERAERIEADKKERAKRNQATRGLHNILQKAPPILAQIEPFLPNKKPNGGIIKTLRGKYRTQVRESQAVTITNNDLRLLSYNISFDKNIVIPEITDLAKTMDRLLYNILTSYNDGSLRDFFKFICDTSTQPTEVTDFYNAITTYIDGRKSGGNRKKKSTTKKKSTKLHKGPRGGVYIIKKGKKIYQ